MQNYSQLWLLINTLPSLTASNNAVQPIPSYPTVAWLLPLIVPLFFFGFVTLRYKHSSTHEAHKGSWQLLLGFTIFAGYVFLWQAGLGAPFHFLADTEFEVVALFAVASAILTVFLIAPFVTLFLFRNKGQFFLTLALYTFGTYFLQGLFLLSYLVVFRSSFYNF